MITQIKLFDALGSFWHLAFGAVQINKRDGLTYVLWRVLHGPRFLNTNGARYDVIPTPVFTDWWA
jgi:hypothetical protein